MDQPELRALFTKWSPLKHTQFLYARYGLNEKVFEDELGLDDSPHRLFEGLARTNKMVCGQIYFNKNGEPCKTLRCKKRAGALYHFGPSDKYNTLLDTPEEVRSAAVTEMQDACRQLGFSFFGYILQASNVPYLPGIVKLCYLGVHTDLHRYVFAEDLALFHPLFIVLP